jgi:hypothetical protein
MAFPISPHGHDGGGRQLGEGNIVADIAEDS